MVNVRTPANPVQVVGMWPPPDYRLGHRVSDADDWATIAAQYRVDVGALIEFNFRTRVPEEVNWYLRELVGCRFAGPKGHNYSFRGAHPAKATIYIPPALPLPTPKPPGEKQHDDVIEETRKALEASTDRRRDRLLCMIAKIQNGGDDRVINWNHIAPKDGVPVPIGIRRRPRENMASGAEPKWLHDHITHVADVDQQPVGNGLGFGNRFVSSLKQSLIFSDGNLLMLMGDHDRIAETPVMLEKWANIAIGGSAGMPSEYRAIHQWIRRVMDDKASVLNCLRSHSAR